MYIMEVTAKTAIYIFLLQTAVRAEGAFICNSVSDSLIKLNSRENLEERMKAMEEQILELQKVVAARYENVTSLHKHRIPTECAEIYDRGVRSDGVYIISPDGRCPFRVYCDMTNGGWTLIQKRQDGSVNFYRPWDDYVDGFGDIDGEHWLGLDKIHRLTKAGTQIYFRMENYDGTFEHAHYQAFTVHDVTTAYRMNVDPFGYEGTLKDRFSYHDDMKFSTFDRDNDKHSTNCCDEHGGGGWWLKDCWHLNPNGVYGKHGYGGIAYYDGGNRPLKNFLIKIQRRKGLC